MVASDRARFLSRAMVFTTIGLTAALPAAAGQRIADAFQPARVEIQRPLAMRGPFTLTAHALERLAARSRPDPNFSDTDDPPNAAACRDCGVHFGDRGEEEGTLQTPPLTTGPYDVAIGGVDPNIAASATHLVITTGGRIAFYTKDGTKQSVLKTA